MNTMSHSPDPTVRISVWSGPRNISTALMYSFAQRPDTVVVDEPFYGYYLLNSSAREYHPGADEVIVSMETDGQKVLEQVVLAPQPKPILFLKNMTHHLINLEWDFTEKLCNVILTRDPVQMLPSYAKEVANPSLHDTGYDTLCDLVDYLTKRGLPPPPVLDSREVLLHPRSVLTQLCEHFDIPFDDGMLNWPAGPRPEDGVWAKYWYESVHRSTGFQPYTEKNEPFPAHLEPLLAECIPYYKRLSALTIHG
ncbi:MAG: sulfotransferase family protein [Chloroflexota bacterium]